MKFQWDFHRANYFQKLYTKVEDVINIDKFYSTELSKFKDNLKKERTERRSKTFGDRQM